MRKGQRITNIGRKGEKCTKSSGRLNHSKEEWKVIIEGIKKRDKERAEANKPITEEDREKFAKALAKVEARYAAEEQARKDRKSKKFYPRKKKQLLEVVYSDLPEELLKSLNIK